MHLYGTAMFADLWRLGDENLRPFLESIARERRIMAAGECDFHTAHAFRQQAEWTSAAVVRYA
jgi:hypothetical protein